MNQHPKPTWDDHSSRGGSIDPAQLEAINAKLAADRQTRAADKQTRAADRSPVIMSSTATPEEISNELERRGQRGRTVARSNGGTARTVVIPTDLDRWHPNEITAWLSGYEEDETVSAADLDRARRAVADALGVDLDHPETVA